MATQTPSTQQSNQQSKASHACRAARLVAPVIGAALAAMVLLVTVNPAQPLISVLRAVLALGLVGAVSGRQIAQILRLEIEVEERARRLHAVTEVVTALNGAKNVGGALKMVLERIVKALGADAGAVWLPNHAGDRFVLVEQEGFDSVEEANSFLEPATHGAAAAGPRDIDRQPHDELAFDDDLPGSIAAVSLGKADDGMGYLCLTQWRGKFSESDWRLLDAVGHDIGNGLRSVRQISEARKLADHDPLTGLFNHRFVHQRLVQEVDKAKKSSGKLAVMMLDLDNFKLYNDTYGHPAGDELLKRVTQVLKSTCRQTDIISRYGGDEFLLLLPGVTPKQAVRTAERIRTALGKKRFRCQDSGSLPMAFSFGIACMPSDCDEPNLLVSRADANLYASKAQGGNTITATGMAPSLAEPEDLSGFDMLQAMVASVDNKDRYTARHSQEVTEYSLMIARELGFSPAELEHVRLSGLLHDVGKIGVPDSILRKPGRLTDEEFSVMRQHPSLGALIVGAMPGLEHLTDGVRYHHERWDGGGYPDGLTGEAIPLVGRLMAVADAFSAMTTSRPYRTAMTHEQALAEVERCLGTQFDPELGALFIRLMAARGEEESPAPRRRRKRARRSADRVAA